MIKVIFMLKKYNHISFDLDGTLVFTDREYRYEIVPKVVKKLGGLVKNNHFIDRFWFEGNRDEIIKNDFDLDPKTFWSTFRIFDEPIKRALLTKSFKDVEKSLKKLKKLDKTISIITGSPNMVAELEMKKLNGAPYDYFFSIESNEYKEKPDPESFNFVLNQLNSTPQKTLYIGNSNEDAYYAKNAGVDFIHIERDEHKFDLKKHAVCIIKSLEELF